MKKERRWIPPEHDSNTFKLSVLPCGYLLWCLSAFYDRASTLNSGLFLACTPGLPLLCLRNQDEWGETPVFTTMDQPKLHLDFSISWYFQSLESWLTQGNSCFKSGARSDLSLDCQVQAGINSVQIELGHKWAYLSGQCPTHWALER